MINSQEQTISRIIKEVKTIAVVGLSSRRHRAGYYVPAYLQQQGYRIVPVNPNLAQSLGEKAYPDLGDIPFPVDLVLLFQRSEKVPPFIEQSIQIGARAVWMQLGIVHEAAAERARAAGLDVVQDACMLVEHKCR